MNVRAALDTNVVVAAVRSRRGASFRVLSELAAGRFDIAVSVPVVLEYEAALMRHQPATVFSSEQLTRLVDSLCAIAHHQTVFYLWRPLLRDPNDDMILEAAVAANCEAIVTFNTRHYREASRFGLSVFTPAEFLEWIGATS